MNDKCTHCGHPKRIHNTKVRFKDETCAYHDSEGPCLCSEEFPGYDFEEVE